MIRGLLNLLGWVADRAQAPAPPAPEEPLTDARRLAHAVLDGDDEAALALADLVLETYRRASSLPEGVTFDTVAWPRRAKTAFRRLGIHSFRRLLETSAGQLLCCRDFGPVTLRQVREVLAAYGLALKGEKPSA
jgi:hypothetical protein